MSTGVAITEKTAKQLLADYLATRELEIMGHRSWSRITFTKRPYWAAVVYILGLSLSGVFGFHVYDNGEVARVGRMYDANPREE